MKLNNKNLLKDKLYINGKWIDSEKKFQVENPATNEIIASLPMGGKSETSKAIEAASSVFLEWKQKPAKFRSKILKKWFSLIETNTEDLARIMTLEQGKSLTEAMGEIRYANSYIEWFSEEAVRSYGDTIPSHRADTRILVQKEPIGVIATITPWNFPAAMMIRKVSAAFAAGCTVVSKPSELTPLTALALVQLGEEAGIPPGVWNLVFGDFESIGEELCTNPIVRKISFTGSTRTGILLSQKSASSVKKMSLELGGNAPFLVFEDANIEKAVEGALSAKFRNSGQTCVCVNRFYVHANVLDEFSNKLKIKIESLKVGNGLEEEIDQGPLINPQAVEKVNSHIQDAIQKGASLKTGGNRHRLGGNFFEPTLLTGIHSEMKICKEETFGPVAAIQSFQTDSEALQLANDTEYGLAAYLFTESVSRIWKFSELLEYGMIGINEGIISSEQIPFGGIKFSGYGREGSKYGMEEFLQTKYLCWGGLNH
ncbi:MAG: NAD-dependent succinate-semialdehyde dehydrogenase [Leptospiraceae bacterium]|nr:NAD-dependent succinate-semialdehyde dehydrogenase [Leptospiraceae bacterium]MCP5512015.1 NAD-dependent succinate-semialdehyde dehydrogenase [Leptospiraceae bacterium]